MLAIKVTHNPDEISQSTGGVTGQRARINCDPHQ